MNCPECNGKWEMRDLREPNFGVCYGAIRRCPDCGRTEYANHCEGRCGGAWRHVKMDAERKKAEDEGKTCPACSKSEDGKPCDRFEACKRSAYHWFEETK